MKWYNWNNDNKKMYLKFLTVASKPVKINYSENLSLNFELAAKVMGNNS